MSFFTSTSLQTVKAPLPRQAQCGKCGLFKTCRSPKMPIDGKGRKGILVIAEAPGENEDRENHPLIGRAGKELWKYLAMAGVERNDCWITNSLICRPTESKGEEGEEEGNRKPSHKELLYCRPNAIKAIETLKPTVILLLGASPVWSILGWLWRDSPGEIGRWAGWRIPHVRLNAWICPTWHPSYLVRKSDDKALHLLFKQHLAAAAKLATNRPWKERPDYAKKIEIVHDPDKAAYALTRIKDEPISFDFETDRKKPDADGSSIICCSVCNGEWSVSFPWTGSVVGTMKELLRSDVPKVGWNARFETRWARRVLDVRVKNWIGDGMLNAHVLDARTESTGLDFRAFVELGVDPWWGKVENFLRSRSQRGNAKNNVKQCPLDDLLRYCAYDSLYEWTLWKKQTKELA